MGDAIHMSGVGGVGMSGVALLLKACGFTVRGTDIRKSAITELLEREGVLIAYEPKPQWCAQSAWVCMPATFPITHVERLAAKEASRIVLTRNQTLSLILSQYCQDTVAVVGTLAKALCAKTIALAASDTERWGWCVGAISRDESSHAKLGQVMAVEFDERDALDDCLPDNTTAIVVSDWQSSSLGYYPQADMLEQILDIAMKRKIACIYPVSSQPKHLAFCVRDQQGTLKMQFDLRQTQGHVVIGLPHPFMPGVLRIRGGRAEACAICAAIVYLLTMRHPASAVYEALQASMASLQFVGWFEKKANLIHDIRMHPVSIRQALENIHETFVLPPVVVFKPYAMTLRAYDLDVWADLLRDVWQCNILPPYEGTAGEDLEALASVLESACKNVCVTTADEAARRMLNDHDRPWLWLGANDILPHAFS